MPPFLIDESNFAEQIHLHNMRQRAFLPHERPGCRQRISQPYRFAGALTAADHITIYTGEQRKELIRAGRGTWLYDQTRLVLPPHNQGGTNYCWAHGTVRAYEANRVYRGEKPQLYSPSSVAVPVTGGRNRGGSFDEAIHRIALDGVAELRFWRDGSLTERDAQPAWEENAIQHRALKWIDVQGWDEQLSCAIARLPVAIGLSWWGHLVCQLEPVLFDDGTEGIGIDNSWGPDWGDNGHGILTRNRGTADLGAGCLYSTTWDAE